MNYNEKTQQSNFNMQEHVANIPFHAYEGIEPYIFVSYAHKDASLVFPEIKRFHNDGYNVWYDQGISPGNEWTEEIAEALEGCSLFIVFITANSVDSINVRNEINFALDTKKPFLAIYLEETELKGGVKLRISSLQGILKYTTTEEEYVWRYRKVFKQHGFKKKENNSENQRDAAFSVEIKETSSKNHKSINQPIINTEEKSAENFTYLNQLIRSGQKEIKLGHDIILEEGEEEKYPEGILLDVDDLIIDGNGHTIDAQEKTRIFQVTGDITIKNITLKKGYGVLKDGGAIHNNNEGKISIKNVTFNSNEGELGGAIYNEGELEILGSELKNNIAKYEGGAIKNKGELEILGSELKNNIAKTQGGAIFNHVGGYTTLQDVKIIKNTADQDGGAIKNKGNLSIKNCTLKNNEGGVGGAIANLDKLTIKDSTLKNNKARRAGAAIYNENRALTMMTDTLLQENTARAGGAIMNYEDGKVMLKDCSLINNIAEVDGAIWTTYPELIKIDNCKFENNILNDIYSEEDN